ncbi:MAG: alpha/beta fold hydrolase [Candidatus Hodarchaeota archaeon]
MSYYTHEEYTIYYKVCGEGEPLLLIHGSTASSSMLEEEVDFYAAYFTVIVVDILGHGQSERLEEFPGDFWNENASVLHGLCQQLNIKKVNILGTSGGAIIGLNFAITYPELTQRVIADSFIGEELSLEEAHALEEERTRAKQHGAERFWRTMHGEDWEQVIDADTKMLLHFAQHYRNNFHDNLDKIQCPVLIIGSLQDNLIKNIAQKACHVAKKIPSSTTVFSPQGDHPLMLSQKTFFRKVVLDFLREETLLFEVSQ